MLFLGWSQNKSQRQIPFRIVSDTAPTRAVGMLSIRKLSSSDLVSRATFWRPTARSSTANRPRSSSSCASWPVWLKGLGIRATARVFEVDPNTVLQWLVEAAEQLRAFSAYFLCDLHLEQLQLDELYAVLRDLKAGEISDDEAIKRLERSPSWVWTAMDPTSKLLVVVDVGSRTLAMAQRVVHQVTQVLAPGCVPLFLTDGLKDYATALLTHFGHWMHPERRQDKGPMPKPRWMPLPALLYAQVVKSYRRRRLVGVKHRVVFGTRLAIEQVLAACGWTINTAFVERLNLDIRQRVAAIGTPGQHAVPGRSGLAGSVGAVPGLSQFRLAPRQSAPAVAAP